MVNVGAGYYKCLADPGDPKFKKKAAAAAAAASAAASSFSETNASSATSASSFSETTLSSPVLLPDRAAQGAAAPDRAVPALSSRNEALNATAFLEESLEHSLEETQTMMHTTSLGEKLGFRFQSVPKTEHYPQKTEYMLGHMDVVSDDLRTWSRTWSRTCGATWKTEDGHVVFFGRTVEHSTVVGGSSNRLNIGSKERPRTG